MSPGAALEPAGRPLLITILCVLGMGTALLSLPVLARLINVFTELYGTWYAVFWGISFIITIASFIGYWLMRRWAVYLYAATFTVGTVVGLIAGLPFTLRGVLVPVAISAIGFAYLRRMR